MWKTKDGKNLVINENGKYDAVNGFRDMCSKIRNKPGTNDDEKQIAKYTFALGFLIRHPYTFINTESLKSKVSVKSEKSSRSSVKLSS